MPSHDPTILNEDTVPIVALSSAPGRGAIAILRLSGQGCHEVAATCLKRSKSDCLELKWETAKLYRCKLVDPDDQTVIDEGMACFFYGPKSYTGQDMVEIYLHGGPYIVKKSLALFLRLGIRAATPGEFTKRSFFAGKIDLTAAEGIHELIEAETEQQWKAARSLASGHLATLISRLREQLIDAQAWLAAKIDFPDEEDSNIDLGEVDSRVNSVREEMAKLDQAYDSGRIASRGLRVVLLGEPNAGKSTLLNALLDFERALVSDVPGTTRDYLEEPCLVLGRAIRLIDTAGLRQSEDRVEAMGIAQSQALAKEADLVIVLASPDNSKASSLGKASSLSNASSSDNASSPGNASSLDKASSAGRERPRLPVITTPKAERSEAGRRSGDLPAETATLNHALTQAKTLISSLELNSKQGLIQILSKADLIAEKIPEEWLPISCKNRTGITNLRERIAAEVDARLGNLRPDTALISNPRQKQCLAQALDFLNAYKEAREENAFDEILAFELQQAAKALGEIIGHCDVEDVLDSVFRNFCMGK